MPRPVVAAAIVDSLSEPTLLLACSRAYPQELRGQFELPGGKVEDGEDPTVALTREIAEELGARLTIGERVCPEGGQWWPILGGRVMGVWLAEVAPNSQEPRAGAFRWWCDRMPGCAATHALRPAPSRLMTALSAQHSRTCPTNAGCAAIRRDDMIDGSIPSGR